MNQLDLSRGGEAMLRYLDADFEVLRAGNFVRCAVTGEAILLRNLRYWSVDRQEAYVDASAANKALDQAKANGEGF
ncbi:MAG: DUF2093 domain-containing protein [Parvularculaceae bacterium]|nr:DUF2093 domain-containing protein [Parvularculaceae bacterium]